MPAREPTHFAYIDAIRGYAFLGVLIHHCALSCGDFHGSALAQTGNYGVQLFFLASAVTLCNSMSARQEGYVAHYRNFYLRRLFRIAPLFWLSMLVYWIVPGAIPRVWLSQWAPHGVHPSYFLLTALFLHGWHPYTFDSIVPGGWSIAVEMTFYLVFPFLFDRVTNLRRAALVLLGGILLTKLEMDHFHQFASRLWPNVHETRITEFFRILWFPSQFAVFLVGIFLYYLLRHPDVKKLHGSRFWSCGILAFCVMALLSILLAGGQSAFIPEHLWVVIAFGGIVISLAGSRIPFTVNPWICHLGKLSYSCYLTHFAALAMVIRIMGFVLRGHLLAQEAGVVKLDSGHGLVNLALFLSMTLSSLILTALFSTVTYHLVENPGIALGKSVIRRIAGRA